MTTAQTATQTAAGAGPILIEERTAQGVHTITLNRPATLNAMSAEMIDALRAAFDRLATDDDARVIVIAANGKAFSAGHDLKELKANAALNFYEELFASFGDLMLAIQALPQPVVARVHAIATAAGCQLVAACDLAVAADTARFGVNGISVGLFCSSPSVALSRNVARKQAFEMLVTGEFVDAATAQAYGLVNRVVPGDQLDAEVERLAAAILDKPAVAIAMGKRLFYRQADASVADAYGLATTTMARNMIDDVAQEGVAAFIEKRPPSWRPVQGS